MVVLRCIACGQEKEVSNFYVDRTRSRGHSTYCKECSSVRNKKYYRKKREEVKAKSAARYWENLEVCREWHREYRQKNKAEFKRRDRKKYLRNRDEHLKNCALRYQDNKESYSESRRRYKKSARGRVVVALSGARRRSILKDLGNPDPTAVLVLKENSSECYFCGAVMNNVPKHPQQKTLDHLTPLSRGGTNVLGNLAFVCHSCNCRKNAMTEGEYRSRLKKCKDVK